jgi:hypothetical protein
MESASQQVVTLEDVLAIPGIYECLHPHLSRYDQQNLHLVSHALRAQVRSCLGWIEGFRSGSCHDGNHSALPLQVNACIEALHIQYGSPSTKKEA